MTSARRQPGTIRAAAVGFCWAMALAGCGNNEPRTYPVAGKITYNAQPLTTGNIMFVTETGPAASAAIRPDGSYRLQCVAGRHQVAITARPIPPPGFDPLASGNDYIPPPALIPDKFNRPSTSNLFVEVHASPNNVADFQLSD